MNDRQRTVQVVITGDWQSPEFELVLTNENADFHYSNVEELLDPDNDRHSDLIVLCQNHRRLNLHDDAEDLMNRYPNSHRVILLGSYCEGETRSGNPVRFWYRRFWYQWEYFYASFCHAYSAQQIHPSNLPATSKDADRLIEMSANENADRLLMTLKSDFAIAIDCRWQSEFDLFADLFATSRVSPLLLDQSSRQSLDCIVLVADSLDEECHRRIKSIKKNYGNTTNLVLLLNFPRLDEWQEAFRLGVHRIVGKPFLNDEFCAAISSDIFSQRLSAVHADG